MHMESLASHADFGNRTTDFFDHSSSDGDAEDGLTGIEHRKGDEPRRTERGRSSQPESDGYLQLSPAREPALPVDTSRFSVDTPSTDFNGSVDELLPDHPSSPPERRSARLSRLSALRGDRPRSSLIQEPRSVPDLEPAYRSSSVIPVSPPAPVTATQSATDVRERVLSAHAIAHEITLHSLMRDEEALDRTLQSFTPMHPGDRGSLLPASLRFNQSPVSATDPRSPGALRKISVPSHPASPLPTTKSKSSTKHVQVLPPHIDTTVSPSSLPDHMVRTPYPSSSPESERHPEINPIASLNPPTESGRETILNLSLRRSATRRVISRHRRRHTTLVLPSTSPVHYPPNIPTAKSPSKPKEYDDESLFLSLRSSYAQLLGPYRYVYPFQLTQIIVVGPSSRLADTGYGWIAPPQSFASQKADSRSTSEEKLLAQFRRPKLGRRRFAFVQWAHRLANAEPGYMEASMSDVDAPGTEGLEFLISWAVGKIVGVLVVVFLLAMAATACWVMLGRSGALPGGDAGYRGAGDRVAGGVAMGIAVLLGGVTVMGAWLGSRVPTFAKQFYQYPHQSFFTFKSPPIVAFPHELAPSLELAPPRYWKSSTEHVHNLHWEINA
ncbi:hypothetical protein LTR95_007073 [Oleoguttula sp. CCFEE 5521]